MGRLAEMVEELEQEASELENTVSSLEDDISDLEQDIEVITQQRDKLQEFKEWVEMAYPEVAKDYGCVKVIEEVANGL